MLEVTTIHEINLLEYNQQINTICLLGMWFDWYVITNYDWICNLSLSCKC